MERDTGIKVGAGLVLTGVAFGLALVAGSNESELKGSYHLNFDDYGTTAIVHRQENHFDSIQVTSSQPGNYTLSLLGYKGRRLGSIDFIVPESASRTAYTETISLDMNAAFSRFSRLTKSDGGFFDSQSLRLSRSFVEE